MDKSDAELILETLNGALNSYDALMQRYQKLIYRVSLAYGKSPENAMDITQNTFLRAYENLRSFKSKGSFKAWIIRIAYHESINWLKKNKKYEKYEMIENNLPEYQSALSQEDELLAREKRGQLLKSIFSLNTKYRLAVVLRYYNNMPISDIAEILNCSEGVVKNMLFRSLKQLKKYLQQMNRGEK